MPLLDTAGVERHNDSVMNRPGELSEENRRLAEALAGEKSALDPGLLALLMAARHSPGLEIELYCARLDDLAARAKTRLMRARAPARVLATINDVLFEEEGFYGNVEDYYDPRNSLLNAVMDSKAGIPISLSVLYLSIARRLHQPIVGVGLPLHFIVKYVGEDGDIYLDPFHRGRTLTVAECQATVERAYGAPIHFQESYLDAVPPDMILYRMLNNLKQCFLRREDYHRAGLAVEQMLIVRPDQAEEIRDRGLLLLHERHWNQAAAFLTRYLRENPDAADADIVRDRLQSAYERRARLN